MAFATSYVALIDAQRLDDYHRLEREQIHLLLVNDASRGLADVAAGKVKEARSALWSGRFIQSRGTGA